MEGSGYYRNNDKGNVEEEESSLLKRLIALKNQLEADDEPKLVSNKNLYSTKENVITNKSAVMSKFKYRKVNNNNVNKFLSLKIDNRNLIKHQNKLKQNNLFTKANSRISNECVSTNSSNLIPVISKTNQGTSSNNQNTEKYNLEINEILKNSLVRNDNLLLNVTTGQSLITTIDNYMVNVQDYLTSSKYVINKEVVNILSTNPTNNPGKNVHVNRKFQNQLISNNSLDSNSRTSNSLLTTKNSTVVNKKKLIKRLSRKCVESPHLIKIGNTKLIRQSLIRNKSKTNCISNNIIERKPLSTLQCPTSNALRTSHDKTKWTKATDSTPANPPKLLKPSNTNKLKWTNTLLVNNANKNSNPIQQSDKLILFGKNKIIRQSLLNPIQSKRNTFLLKHFTHRFALLRKLKLKTSIHRVQNITPSNENFKNNTFLKKSSCKPIEMKKNGKRLYSYVNPILRSKTNENFCLKRTESSIIKKPSIDTISNVKIQQNLKVMNNDINKNTNLTITRIDKSKSKKTLTKQLCLVFNRFGSCTKFDQGNCDKRHYKKYVILCNKFLIGECFTENCSLSHIIAKEKIPFCKHYLNSVCVQLNCPYIHEYRDSKTPICKQFLHGTCTLGKKCLKKHLNLCPIFEAKNKCPHGLKCLYPHNQSEGKKIVDGEINEPRYFEMSLPNNEESKENESYHIVPKRHAPLTDLPSYIPL